MDEFIDGCAKLQGEATALETKVLHLEVWRSGCSEVCDAFCVFKGCKFLGSCGVSSLDASIVAGKGWIVLFFFKFRTSETWCVC